VTSRAPAGEAASDGWRASLRRVVLDRPTYLIFAAVTLFFIAFAPNFASLSTAEAILRITALVTIMAVGMTFVIICAEIDLSVGSVASWSGMIAALLLDRGAPGWLAPILVLGMGAAIGVVNGLLVTKLGIPSFLVTLGMLSVFSGLSLTVTGTEPVPIVDDFFYQPLLERRPVRRAGANLVDDRRHPRRLLRFTDDSARPAGLRGRRQSCRRALLRD